MGEAERLVFLGFAFHDLNMELIKPGKRINATCYATTYDFSDSNKDAINKQIDSLCSSIVNTEMANLKCKPFFDEFEKNLAF